MDDSTVISDEEVIKEFDLPEEYRVANKDQKIKLLEYALHATQEDLLFSFNRVMTMIVILFTVVQLIIASTQLITAYKDLVPWIVTIAILGFFLMVWPDLKKGQEYFRELQGKPQRIRKAIAQLMSGKRITRKVLEPRKLEEVNAAPKKFNPYLLGEGGFWVTLGFGAIALGFANLPVGADVLKIIGVICYFIGLYNYALHKYQPNSES